MSVCPVISVEIFHFVPVIMWSNSHSLAKQRRERQRDLLHCSGYVLTWGGKRKVSGVNFLEDCSSCTSIILLADGYRRCYNSGEFVFCNSPSSWENQIWLTYIV